MKKELERLKEYGHVIRILKNYETELQKNGLSEHDKGIYDNLVSQAEAERLWVENFVNSIEDLFIREIVIQRFIKGKQWNAVAVAMGGYASADCYRKAVSRAFACPKGRTSLTDPLPDVKGI